MGQGGCAQCAMGGDIGVPPLSPLPAFPRCFGDALQRGRIKICSRDMNNGDTIFT